MTNPVYTALDIELNKLNAEMHGYDQQGEPETSPEEALVKLRQIEAKIF